MCRAAERRSGLQREENEAVIVVAISIRSFACPRQLNACGALEADRQLTTTCHRPPWPNRTPEADRQQTPNSGPWVARRHCPLASIATHWWSKPPERRMPPMMVLPVSLAAAALQTQPSPQPQGVAISPPKPAMRQDGLIGRSAYPTEALRKRQEGKTTLAVHVSSKGRVTTCSIAESSGSSSLDDASCAFVRHVRFDPARDENGRAVEADTRFPMTWNLPKD
jgi:protein TonB